MFQQINKKKHCLVVLDSFGLLLNCVGCSSAQTYQTAIKHAKIKWRDVDCAFFIGKAKMLYEVG